MTVKTFIQEITSKKILRFSNYRMVSKKQFAPFRSINQCATLNKLLLMEENGGGGWGGGVGG
jgi:hypothetical protein